MASGPDGDREELGNLTPNVVGWVTFAQVLQELPEGQGDGKGTDLLW